jgi:aspartate/methionine/tyrosine aminotransferase
MEKRTITINSISKTYSVTGWRMGWAIASAEITARIRKVHDFLTVGAPTPFQHAAAEALTFPGEYYIKLQQKYAQSRDHLTETLINSGFKPFIPQGAYYIITDVSALWPVLGAENDMDFSRKLIERTRVATVPGSSFYSGDNIVSKKVRFAFCKKQETLEMVRSLFLKYL